ncbi:MAG: sigma-70 family RNA polymerase sigma factor [Desulfobacterales bacterium]|jgi:RNA polymerase sigma factor (sigma-70 family)
MDPETLFFSDDLYAKIEAVCKRHFSAENNQSECSIFVIDSLKANNFKRLRDFKGKSSLNTYLYSLINSLVIDFKRKKFGRRRIPAGVVKLGKWAEAVYRFVCWQKFSYDDAYDFLMVDGLFTGSYDEFIRAAEPIRRAPCRENPAFQSSEDARKGDLKNIMAGDSNPLETLIQKLDRERRIRALKIIKETTARMSGNDRLLVKLVYGSDRSLTAAAKVLGLPASTARNRLKRLLTTYRESLLAEGIREP